MSHVRRHVRATRRFAALLNTSTVLIITMQLAKVWFSLLALAACALAVEPPTELQIETTFMPENCPVKAGKGDTVSVHYVSKCLDSTRPLVIKGHYAFQTGTLFDGGKKFDSRSVALLFSGSVT
jgi:hypothetical protein